MESIPVINFSDPDRLRRAKDLTKAMAEVGFVYLENIPGYDKQLEDKLFQASKWFFGLPLQEKLKISPKKWNPSAKGVYRGYIPIDIERDQLREQYETGETLPEDDPFRLSGIYLYEPTPYPYPEQVEGIEFRKLIESARQIFSQTAIEFLRLTAIGLGMEENVFDERFSCKPASSLRLMHYPTYEKEKGNLDTLTCEEHMDSVFVTLLVTFGYPGLEIERSDGSWIPVPPRPGSIILNIGTLLSRVTNGRFKATMHRVKDIGGDRYSLPFFLEPNGDAKFTFPDDSSTIVYGSWLTNRMKASYPYQFGQLPDYKLLNN